MARTTMKDRARKARIREREFRAASRQMRKLDNITDAQIETLKQLKTAEASGKPVNVSSIANWEELHAMGTVKEHEGILILTSTGAKVAAYAN